MTRTEEIINILSEFIIPKCELNFNNNYELLVAVLLSAQTTDKAVNKVCEKLFLKYKTIFDLATAKEEDIYIIIKTLGLANTKSKNLKKLANVIVDNLCVLIEECFELERKKVQGISNIVSLIKSKVVRKACDISFSLYNIIRKFKNICFVEFTV